MVDKSPLTHWLNLTEKVTERDSEIIKVQVPGKRCTLKKQDVREKKLLEMDADDVPFGDSLRHFDF